MVGSADVKFKMFGKGNLFAKVEMRLIRNLIGAVVFMAIVDSCFSPPIYSIVPEIEFDNIYYGKAKAGVGLDSIVISLKFKDGDGDLGLNTTEADTVFRLQSYFTFQGALVTYKIKRQNPSLGLPDFVTPFSCTNWDVRKNNSGVVLDTLYTVYNPNYYNIFVDFYVNDIRFDPATYFTYPGCSIGGYNGRFPVLSVDIGKKSPLDGKITYSLKGVAFDFLFSINQLKLKIRIQDRALHKSNEITTPAFTLQSIRR